MTSSIWFQIPTWGNEEQVEMEAIPEATYSRDERDAAIGTMSTEGTDLFYPNPVNVTTINAGETKRTDSTDPIKSFRAKMDSEDAKEETSTCGSANCCGYETKKLTKAIKKFRAKMVTDIDTSVKEISSDNVEKKVTADIFEVAKGIDWMAKAISCEPRLEQVNDDPADGPLPLEGYADSIANQLNQTDQTLDMEDEDQIENLTSSHENDAAAGTRHVPAASGGNNDVDHSKNVCDSEIEDDSTWDTLNSNTPCPQFGPAVDAAVQEDANKDEIEQFRQEMIVEDMMLEGDQISTSSPPLLLEFDTSSSSCKSSVTPYDDDSVIKNRKSVLPGFSSNSSLASASHSEEMNQYGKLHLKESALEGEPINVVKAKCLTSGSMDDIKEPETKEKTAGVPINVINTEHLVPVSVDDTKEPPRETEIVEVPVVITTTGHGTSGSMDGMTDSGAHGEVKSDAVSNCQHACASERKDESNTSVDTYGYNRAEDAEVQPTMVMAEGHEAEAPNSKDDTFLPEDNGNDRVLDSITDQIEDPTILVEVESSLEEPKDEKPDLTDLIMEGPIEKAQTLNSKVICDETASALQCSIEDVNEITDLIMNAPITQNLELESKAMYDEVVQALKFPKEEVFKTADLIKVFPTTQTQAVEARKGVYDGVERALQSSSGATKRKDSGMEASRAQSLSIESKDEISYAVQHSKKEAFTRADANNESVYDEVVLAVKHSNNEAFQTTDSSMELSKEMSVATIQDTFVESNKPVYDEEIYTLQNDEPRHVEAIGTIVASGKPEYHDVSQGDERYHVEAVKESQKSKKQHVFEDLGKPLHEGVVQTLKNNEGRHKPKDLLTQNDMVHFVQPMYDEVAQALQSHKTHYSEVVVEIMERNAQDEVAEPNTPMSDEVERTLEHYEYQCAKDMKESDEVIETESNAPESLVRLEPDTAESLQQFESDAAAKMQRQEKDEKVVTIQANSTKISGEVVCDGDAHVVHPPVATQVIMKGRIDEPEELQERAIPAVTTKLRAADGTVVPKEQSDPPVSAEGIMTGQAEAAGTLQASVISSVVSKVFMAGQFEATEAPQEQSCPPVSAKVIMTGKMDANELMTGQVEATEDPQEQQCPHVSANENNYNQEHKYPSFGAELITIEQRDFVVDSKEAAIPPVGITKHIEDIDRSIIELQEQAFSDANKEDNKILEDSIALPCKESTLPVPPEISSEADDKVNDKVIKRSVVQMDTDPSIPLEISKKRQVENSTGTKYDVISAIDDILNQHHSKAKITTELLNEAVQPRTEKKCVESPFPIKIVNIERPEPLPKRVLGVFNQILERPLMHNTENNTKPDSSVAFTGEPPIQQDYIEMIRADMRFEEGATGSELLRDFVPPIIQASASFDISCLGEFKEGASIETASHGLARDLDELRTVTAGQTFEWKDMSAKIRGDLKAEVRPEIEDEIQKNTEAEKIGAYDPPGKAADPPVKNEDLREDFVHQEVESQVQIQASLKRNHENDNVKERTPKLRVLEDTAHQVSPAQVQIQELHTLHYGKDNSKDQNSSEDISQQLLDIEDGGTEAVPLLPIQSQKNVGSKERNSTDVLYEQQLEDIQKDSIKGDTLVSTMFPFLVAPMSLLLFFVVAGHGMSDTAVFLSSPKPLFALGLLAPMVAFLGDEEEPQFTDTPSTGNTVDDSMFDL